MRKRLTREIITVALLDWCIGPGALGLLLGIVVGLMVLS